MILVRLQSLFKVLLSFLVMLQLISCSGDEKKRNAILIFSKNKATQSNANDAAASFYAFVIDKGIKADTTTNPAYFTEDSLRNYGAVVFLQTSEDVLNTRQQNDFERFIQAGGGFVGIHAAGSTKYQWPWYHAMLGAKFSEMEEAKINSAGKFLQVNNVEKPFDKDKAGIWEQADKLFQIEDFDPENNVLVETMEKMPVSWFKEFDGGTMFYTAAGGISESFYNKGFLEHLLAGVHYTLEGPGFDYEKTHTERVPEDNRFLPVVLDDYLNEPIEMEIMMDGRVLFVERHGKVKLYDPEKKQTKELAALDVHTTGNYEDGLLGLELDPLFEKNNYIYLYYSPVGEKSVQNLSRFKLLGGDSLIMASEKVVLEVPVQRETCCHSAGNIYFGYDGYLYLTTGDNTSSKESDGFSPIDERPGRGPFDAQKSSGNTHDLRGKILRIDVKADASYTIPDGNLFPKDGSEGSPEIYIMGARNPYRVTTDKRGYVYWGDVGPDGGRTTERGPKSYDEWNQAKAPGNYGWPYFVADNKAYADFDFATNEIGPKFNPERPINESPYNYGAKVLPSAQEAMIWYPYDGSEEFPMLGTGSRSAMLGPFFYVEDYKRSRYRFPAYFNEKLFIFEWARSWMKVLTFDEKGDLQKIEPFLPNYDFAHPIDVKFGPDGAMYVLTYGANYFAQNPDAQLIKIDYAEGNREPVAHIEVDKNVGSAPFKIKLSGASSFDYDKDDKLQFSWESGEGEQSTAEAVEFTYTEPGVFRPILTVTDNNGDKATAEVEIKVGNEIPVVDINLDQNQSFYFGDKSLAYSVAVQDKEDGKLGSGIAAGDVFFSIDYLPEGQDLALLASNNDNAERTSARFLKGKVLVEGSDCKSCHAMDKKSIGPHWMEISGRYTADDETVTMLSDKIIKGGNGNWGKTMMAAHPQHTLEEANEMVRYILSLGKADAGKLPLQGNWKPEEHKRDGTTGTYILTASYTDKGSEFTGRLTGRKTLVLRNPKVQAEDYDAFHNLIKRVPHGEGVGFIGDIKHGSYFSIEGIDLQGIGALTINAASRKNGGTIEIRSGAADGTLMGSIDITPVPDNQWEWREFTIPLGEYKGVNDIFFVFKNESVRDNLMMVDWIYFGDRETI